MIPWFSSHCRLHFKSAIPDRAPRVLHFFVAELAIGVIDNRNDHGVALFLFYGLAPARITSAAFSAII